MWIDGVERILRFGGEKVVSPEPHRLEIPVRVHDLHLDHKLVNIERPAGAYFRVLMNRQQHGDTVQDGPEVAGWCWWRRRLGHGRRRQGRAALLLQSPGSRESR